MDKSKVPRVFGSPCTLHRYMLHRRPKGVQRQSHNDKWNKLQ